MKNLVSKENITITLALIGADEVASRIDATTTQAFDAEMKKDSSDEESDGDDTDPEYGGNERVSVLSNEEDEEGEQTAKGTIVTPVTTKGGDAQAHSYSGLFMSSLSSTLLLFFSLMPCCSQSVDPCLDTSPCCANLHVSFLIDLSSQVPS